MIRLALLGLFAMTSLLNAAEPLDGLDADVAKALKAHGVPGLGVAVVKDGKVILARGFGVKEVGKPEPVTEKTLFAIGSVTKSFTVALAAMLVDEGVIEWDDPLRVHLPQFRLQDRFYSDEVTLRDCFCHRVGLARNDLLWYGSPFDRDEILFRMRKLKPDARIRTAWIYNNLMYLAAGEALAKAAGKPWDDLIAKRLFKPLGMATANTSATKFAKDADKAEPHRKLKGKPAAVAWRSLDNVAPAGAINACAAEMAEYVKFQLATGKVGGKTLIERGTFAEMHKPIVFLPRGPFSLNPETKLLAYALGWTVSDFHGSPLIEHGGNVDGMTANIMLMPEKKIGVMTLANLNSSLLPASLNYDILERLLGHEPENRAFASSLYAFSIDQSVQLAGEPEAGSRVKDTKPTFKLADYAGRFENDLLAPVKVICKTDELKIEFNTFCYDLEHWHYDTFVGTDRTNAMPKVLFTFDQSSDGKVAAVRFTAQAGEELRMMRVKKN